MITRLVIVTLLLVGTARAELLPTGCYVEYANVSAGTCYTPQQSLNWFESGDIFGFYGLAVGDIISSYVGSLTSYDLALNACEAHVDQCVALGNSVVAERNNCFSNVAAIASERDSCNASAATIISQRDLLSATSVKQAKLIKKLKRACGSTCKSIR